MEARNLLFQRMQFIAEHDQLTGVFNRRAFLEYSRILLAEPAAEKTPLSVLMLDIDHFKKINDTYGHAAGDLVLTTFTQGVDSCLRSTDIFGRLGGEEFAIVLPGCAQAQAMVIADRIRKTFAEAVVCLDSGEILLNTVSIGITWAERVAPDIEKFLLMADKALYVAKAAGRNCVEYVPYPCPEN